MIEYHNPQAEVGIENTAYTLAACLSGKASVNVGFLANGFPDSESFLDALSQAMQELEPGIQPFMYNKGNASIPAPAALLDEAGRECAAVVAAYGHWGSCTTGTVRDGINLAMRGIPAVALVTQEFWSQGDFVAQSLGMPDIPRVQLPHPVAGTGTQAILKIAQAVAPAVIAALEKRSD